MRRDRLGHRVVGSAQNNVGATLSPAGFAHGEQPMPTVTDEVPLVLLVSLQEQRRWFTIPSWIRLAQCLKHVHDVFMYIIADHKASIIEVNLIEANHLIALTLCSI